MRECAAGAAPLVARFAGLAPRQELLEERAKGQPGRDRPHRDWVGPLEQAAQVPLRARASGKHGQVGPEHKRVLHEGVDLVRYSARSYFAEAERGLDAEVELRQEQPFKKSGMAIAVAV
jgi:hypothetical protein